MRLTGQMPQSTRPLRQDHGMTALFEDPCVASDAAGAVAALYPRIRYMGSKYKLVHSLLLCSKRSAARRRSMPSPDLVSSPTC